MDFKYILPTIGLNLGEIYVGDKVRLNMLDLGGQKEIRHLWDKVRILFRRINSFFYTNSFFFSISMKLMESFMLLIAVTLHTLKNLLMFLKGQLKMIESVGFLY